MTNKQKIISALVVAGAIGSLGLGSYAYACDDGADGGGRWNSLTDEQKQQIEEGQAQMQEYRDAIDQALLDGDYSAWIAAKEAKPEITDYVNEDNFDQYTQMHQFMKDGDFEAADEIREQLGIPMGTPGIGGSGMGKGMHKGNKGQGKGKGMHNCGVEDEDTGTSIETESTIN